MKIDFDNYRKQTVNDFNKLIEFLNEKTLMLGTDDDPLIILTNDLRNKVVTLCCIEIEGEGVKSIIDDVKIKSYGDYI